MHNQTIITTVEQYTDKVIIDCETRSVPKNSEGKWDNTLCDPFMFGFFHKNQLIQVVHWGEDWESFIKMLNEVIKDLPQPFYGLNNELEHFGLLNAIKRKIEVIDVRRMKGKGTSKQDMYALLVKHKGYPEVKDPMNFNGELCILYYNLIKEGTMSMEQTKQHMEDILGHNKNCLLLEASILKEKEFLESCYDIDAKGWVRGLKK